MSEPPDTPARPPTPVQPPTTFWSTNLSICDALFPTKDAAEDALRMLCYSSNFSFSRAGASRQKKYNAYNPDGLVKRYDYNCTLGGANRARRYSPTGQRAASSCKTGCEWHAKIVRQLDGQWSVGFVKSRDGRLLHIHNHGPAADLISDAALRRWWRASHPGLVEGWVERLSLAQHGAEKISSYLRGDLDIPDLDQESDADASPESPSNASINAIDLDFSWGDRPTELPASSTAQETPSARPPLQRPQRMPVTAADVANIQAKLRREKYGPLSVTQLFVEQLERNQRRDGLAYKLQRKDDRIVRIFWTYQSCIKMWRKHPDILIVDNICKVNRFNMPLCQITGTTSIHTNYCVAFALTSGETEDDFAWVLAQLKSLSAEFQIPDPQTILTDFSHAFKIAAAREGLYHGVQQQFCLWHVNKNVIYHMKKKWHENGANLEGNDSEEDGDGGDIPAIPSGLDLAGCNNLEASLRAHDEDIASAAATASCLLDEEAPGSGENIQDASTSARRWSNTHDGFVQAWQAVTRAETEQAFWATWKLVVQEFREQSALLQYLQKHYLPWRSQWARYATKTYKNYGIYASSRVESTQAELKKLMRNRLADLSKLYRVIRQIVNAKKSTYITQNNREESTGLPVVENIALIRPLSRKISRHALRELHRQHQMAQAEVKTRRRTECTNTFRRQWGLPCKHDILHLLNARKTLTLDMVDKHWYLAESMQPLSDTRPPRQPQPDARSPPGSSRPQHGPQVVRADFTVDRLNREPSHDEAVAEVPARASHRTKSGRVTKSRGKAKGNAEQTSSTSSTDPALLALLERQGQQLALMAAQIDRLQRHATEQPRFLIAQQATAAAMGAPMAAATSMTGQQQQYQWNPHWQPPPGNPPSS